MQLWIDFLVHCTEFQYIEYISFQYKWVQPVPVQFEYNQIQYNFEYKNKYKGQFEKT